MVPSLSERSAPISVKSVVLPEPDGPVITTSWPGWTAQLMSNSTWLRASPSP